MRRKWEIDRAGIEQQKEKPSGTYSTLLEIISGFVITLDAVRPAASHHIEFRRVAISYLLLGNQVESHKYRINSPIAKTSSRTFCRSS